ncbi:hypothetical protein QOZ98_000274 [Planomicrobium stackebrandtii]|uniref:Uncharacterized protein n=1 Tax=Planomicrobium stackebrandtii TaxID=253160 RepID=A0ABU0GR53_9BACL|nr:hypothetical protein [Planomicrobium stackebrandtii]MDQ0427449.1 hypothetical protein [Planomicrobium stackebrandtii]
MKIRMLLLSLFVSIQVQAHAPYEQLEHIDSRASRAESEILSVSALSDFYPKESHFSPLQYKAFETSLAGVSAPEKQRGVAKADLDEKAGRVDWTTAIIVVCVAFFVYLINKSKKLDID